MSPNLLRPEPRPLPLDRLLAGFCEVSPEHSGVLVTGVAMDSRLVRPGDLYAALAGATTHGAKFGATVTESGAVAIVTDAAGADLLSADGCELPVITVADPREIVGELSARAYGRPGDELLLIGVTGTNGKTTMSFLLESALAASGHVTGVIGTTGHLIAGEAVPSIRTTPEAPEVHALLGVMRDRGVTAAVMEVSSHALSFNRVNGLVFDAAVFTNLTQDHLDFHGTMVDYFAAKASLFTPGRARQAVICLDDEWGHRLLDHTQLPSTTYAVDAAEADWLAVDLRPGPEGTEFEVEHGGVRVPVSVRLPGLFNVANALGAVATAVSVGVPVAVAAAAVGTRAGVRGRMQPVLNQRRVRALVDYAHTPDAVRRAIAAVSPGPGRTIVVLGCGGDRDAAKRPIMGDVAARLADILVITDDNPRSEDPRVIRDAMAEGAMSVPEAERASIEIIGDRRAAIKRAAEVAGPGDALLVLGKGHELGQDVGGVVHPFDDAEVLAEMLAVKAT